MHRMFDIDDARFVGLIDQGVGLLTGLIVVGLKDTVDHAHQKRGLAIFFRARIDQGTKVERERNQTLFGGF